MLKLIAPEKEVLKDEKTGGTVWRMTRGGHKNVTCYPEVEAFTEDEKYVLFSSDRTGEFNLYRAELKSGEIARLSEAPGFEMHSFSVSGDGTEALYSAGWTVHVVDVETGEERAAADLRGKLPYPPRPFPPAVSRCSGEILVAFETGSGSTGLAFASIVSGECRKIFEWPGKISHPQIWPGSDGFVTFCPAPDTQDDMSLPPEKRARTWILDVKTGKARPFLIAPSGFRATHEYWDFTGSRMYYHRKSVPDWTPAALCSVNSEGGDPRVHYESSSRKLGHSSIDRESRFMISDVQESGNNELIRVDLKTGKGKVLCWPDTVYGAGHANHVHPSISARGNYVDFSSARSGAPDLYVLPLNG